MTRIQKLEAIFFIVRVGGVIIIGLNAGWWAALGCFILVAGESAARTVGTVEGIKLVLEAVGKELDKKADK